MNAYRAFSHVSTLSKSLFRNMPVHIWTRVRPTEYVYMRMREHRSTSGGGSCQTVTGAEAFYAYNYPFSSSANTGYGTVGTIQRTKELVVRWLQLRMV